MAVILLESPNKVKNAKFEFEFELQRDSRQSF